MNDEDAKDGTTFNKHAFENRGSKSIMFLNSNQMENIPVPADAYFIDFMGDNV